MNYSYERGHDGVITIRASIGGETFDIADVYSRPFRESGVGKNFPSSYSIEVQEAFAKNVCRLLNKI